MPNISVVIPNYNRSEFLTRALDSIASQSRLPDEVWVVQNGGLTTAQSICKSFKRRLRINYVALERPCAVSARNAGVRRTRADLIAFMDDDDLWERDKLRIQERAFQENPELGLCAVSGTMIDENGNEIATIPSEWDASQPVTYETLLGQGCYIYSLSSVMIKRKCFHSVGLFNDNYLIANDYEFYLRLARKYAVSLLPDRLFRYTRHTLNLSQQKEGQMWAELVSIIKDQDKSWSRFFRSTFIKDALGKYAIQFYRLAGEHNEVHDYRTAFRYYLSAIDCDPLIGQRVPWSRIDSAIYRLVRPYGAAMFTGVKAALLQT